MKLNNGPNLKLTRRWCQMAGRAGARSASLLAAWIVLLGRGIGASPDTELLMQTPFARDLGWVKAAYLCNTEEILCDDHDSVISLTIRPHDATTIKIIPPGWGSLTHLVNLTLSGAAGGSLPPEWGSNGSLPKLERLYLSSNNLSGSLPAGWGSNGSFPLLQQLYLDGNNLSGSLPAGWVSEGSFPKLQQLDLSNNHISNISHDTELLMEAPFASALGWTAAADLCNSTSVATIDEYLLGFVRSRINCDIHFNVINMMIQAQHAANVTVVPGWGNLKQLVNLTLSGAAGSLPPDWGRHGAFPQLQEMKLINNSISGSLPPEWGSNISFPHLHLLVLENNNISGSLPPGWGCDGCFTELEILSLSINNLSSSLPLGWGSNGSFPKLQVLSLSDNNLSGNLPAGWGKHGSFPLLQQLWLDNNSVSGSLPLEWSSESSFPQLQQFGLHNNHIWFSVSLDMELLMQAPFARALNWTAAAYLCNSISTAANVTCDVHGNVIEMVILVPSCGAANFTLPPGWASLAHLVNLTVSGAVGGSLPSKWGSDGSFPNLQRLYVSSTYMNDCLPQGWGSSGSFPQLQVLNLTYNSLSGSLPPEWGSNGSFPQLQVLWLNNNSLSGTLPLGWGSFGSFPKLWQLWLSGNTLSGSLPPGWGNKGSFTQLRQLVLSNNKLGGTLPPGWGGFGSFPELQQLWLSSNNLSGSLPVKWGVPSEIYILAAHDPDFAEAAPFVSVNRIVLIDNNFTGGVPLEWTNNMHFLNSLLLDKHLLRASRDSPDFVEGICLHPYSYVIYRSWIFGIKNSDECREYLVSSNDLNYIPADCLKPATDLGDPCSLARESIIVIIVVVISTALVVMLISIKGRTVTLLDRYFKGFPESRAKVKAWIANRPSPPSQVFFGMLATLFAFWADIVSDVPVVTESWKKIDIFNIILLALMVGSHTLDAILIARYAVAKGEKKPLHNQGPSSIFSLIPQKAVWFMMYFSVAVLALPAMDVLGAINPSRELPAKSIDLEGYQTMRLVIGAIFRTVPTFILQPVIAVIFGNDPENGKYISPTSLSISLIFCGLQIIVFIVQVDQRAKASKKSKVGLLRSVFTLDGLALLSDEVPWQTSEDKAVELEPISNDAISQSM